MQALKRHVMNHLGWYVPAFVPIVMVFVCMVLALIALFLPGDIKHSLYQWSVYGLLGFLPILICSYGCFFLLLHFGVLWLAKRFPHWSDGTLHFGIATLYGLGAALMLLLWVRPEGDSTPQTMLVIGLIGLVCGWGNWHLFRKLTPTDLIAHLRQHLAEQEHAEEPSDDEE